MRLAELFVPAPREIRLAGAITAVLGVAALVFAVILLVDALTGTSSTPGGNSVYAQAVVFAVLGLCIVAPGMGLFLGHVWARSPCFVWAIILGGLGLYMALPSGRPLIGIPVIALAAALMVMMFRASAQAWALGENADDAVRGDRS